MNNFYELNESDFKNLVEILSGAGIVRALAGYRVYNKSKLKMSYIEYDRDPEVVFIKKYKGYLYADIFYWQLLNNPLRKKVSIDDVMEDLVNRSNLVLNEKHNLDEKNYERNLEIVIDVKNINLEVFVHLITPFVTISDVAKLNLLDLIEKKGVENESIWLWTKKDWRNYFW